MDKSNAFEIIRKELVYYDLKTVADASGLNLQTLYNWVNRKNIARIENLCKVAEVLGYNLIINLKK